MKKKKTKPKDLIKLKLFGKTKITFNIFHLSKVEHLKTNQCRHFERRKEKEKKNRS